MGLQRNPNDAALVARIGRALVQTHSYAKALAHYEAALTGGPVAPGAEKRGMQYDLAALYFKLKKLAECERALAQILERGSADDDEGLGDAQAAMQVRSVAA